MNPRPIVLLTAPRDGAVDVRVRGEAAEPIEAAFTLVVSAGGNRSEHRGRARLAAGETAILSAVSAATGADGGWRAVLRVDPVGGAPYQQIGASSDAG